MRRFSCLSPLRLAFVVICIVSCVTTSSLAQEDSSAADPQFEVVVYDSERAWPGTTIFGVPGQLHFIEVNMLGEVVWEYEHAGTTPRRPGIGEAEVLDNGNLIFLTQEGLCEIDRDGNVVWSHNVRKVSHDVDRLDSGNTLFVFGGRDSVDDYQVREIDAEGNEVWSWYARDHFDFAPYDEVSAGGWTHANSATRLENGNTLISLRNFNFLVIVDADGNVVNTIGEGIIYSPHDPEVLENGNILVVSQHPLSGYLDEGPISPDELTYVTEIDPATNEVVWSWDESHWDGQLTRDANRLPNGNTLIVGSNRMIEVTQDGDVVWELRSDTVFSREMGSDRARLGFYKAERIW